MKLWALAGGAILALLSLGSRAQAAPPEIFSELALHPTDPNRMVLAYVWGGQGLLFSNDGGHSFSLRCGAAVSGSFTKSRSPLLVTLDGDTLLGTFGGLVRGGDDGCGFGDDARLAGLQVADFARHPSDPAVTFLATANPSDGRPTGLVRRNADGTFSALGPGAPAADAGAGATEPVSMNRLGVVARADGGLRFYATALVADDAGDYHPVIRHSDDEGTSWVSFDVAGAEGARVLLVAVDPTNPDRIALAIQRDEAPDTLLASTDAGQTLEPRLELYELGASSVAPDGRLWVGDAGGEAEYSQPGGLYLLDDFTAPARKLATYPVRCLGYRALDGALFGCKRNEFGSVDPATGDFTLRASLATVGGFVSCGSEALAPVCKPQLCDNWCGVLHYASAPLCDAYDEVNPVCGPAARGYGQANPPGGAAGAAALVLPGDEPMTSAPDTGAPRAPVSAPAPTPAAASARASAGCQIGPLGLLPPSWAKRGLGLSLALSMLALGGRRRSRRQEAGDRAPAARARIERTPARCNRRRLRRH